MAAQSEPAEALNSWRISMEFHSSCRWAPKVRRRLMSWWGDQRQRDRWMHTEHHYLRPSTIITLSLTNPGRDSVSLACVYKYNGSCVWTGDQRKWMLTLTKQRKGDNATGDLWWKNYFLKATWNQNWPKLNIYGHIMHDSSVHVCLYSLSSKCNFLRLWKDFYFSRCVGKIWIIQFWA